VVLTPPALVVVVVPLPLDIVDVVVSLGLGLWGGADAVLPPPLLSSSAATRLSLAMSVRYCATIVALCTLNTRITILYDPPISVSEPETIDCAPSIRPNSCTELSSTSPES
jgi:hypothetical protein